MYEVYEQYASNYAVLIAIIGFFQTVSVAVIGGLLRRESSKRKTAQEELKKRSEVRAKESMLSMKLMSASNGLSMVTARAIRDGKTNGEMDIALAEAGNAQGDYFKFINRIASERMSAD